MHTHLTIKLYGPVRGLRAMGCAAFSFSITTSITLSVLLGCDLRIPLKPQTAFYVGLV